MHKEMVSIILVAAIVVLASACNTATDEMAAEKSTAADKVAEQGSSTTADAGETASAKCKIVPPAEPFACTMQYDPVCGCDGKTYANACMARGAGVPESTPGECEKETVE